MRSFVTVCMALLLLLAAASLYVGSKVIGDAETSVQEIEGLISMLIFAVSLGCAGIIAAIRLPGPTR
jgi:hypothetical protein